MRTLVLLCLQILLLAPVTLAEERPLRESIEWCDLWVTAADRPEVGKVLLIGDSITRSYYEPVQSQLAGQAHCARLATSKCVADPAFLDELRVALSHGPFVAIHFNNGLHGFKYSEEQYRAGLIKALDLIQQQAPTAKLVWGNTTPMRQREDLQKLAEDTVKIVQPRNRLAAEIMQARGIPIDDLYTVGAEHPEFYSGDGVHFNDAGRAFLAKQVAAIVSQQLAVVTPQEPPVTKPESR